VSNLTLPGLPGELRWINTAASWKEENGALQIVAPAKTDLFVDPAGGMVKDDSPRAVFTPDPQFTLSAHVTVDFVATYDAGVLVLCADGLHWAKLCFEYSPQGEPMIVSVVTNGVSDDCNAVPLTRNDIYLRVTRLGQAFAFHYSEDGKYWRMVRYFALQQVTNLRVGFSSQSPTGDGCRAAFDQIQYRASAVKDVRSGE
jgi:regulation of enolase protein 1 (concanavalin A-like superfamily)